MSRIIFLHGPSSSGKSTLAKAIVDQSPTPFLILSFDTFRNSGALTPVHFVQWPRCRSSVFAGLHQCFSGYANAGCDLIIEHILDTPGWHAELQERLAGHDVLFVGVDAPLDVLDAREAERGDRPAGSARADAAHVHQGLSYDFWADGTSDPQTTARQILRQLEANNPSGFFDVASTPRTVSAPEP